MEMENDYQFTGQTSASGEGGADIDDLASYFQESGGRDYTSMEPIEQVSETDRAVRSECRMCASHQGGTNTDNLLDELAQDTPRQTEADDLVDSNYIDEMYHTDGEYQQREWKDYDNTGGDGVPTPEMPDYLGMTLRSRR